MSIGEVLCSITKEFEDLTESECEDDIWDEKKINKAYGKALKLASTEVAKRLAMSTNTKLLDNAVGSKPKKNTSLNSSKINCKQWQAGMFCRAPYAGDNLEYEATVLRIINSEECVIKFVGYENSEIVPLNTLKPTLGKEFQTKQLEEAALQDKPTRSKTAELENMECYDKSCISVSSTEKSCYQKKKPSKRKNQSKKSSVNSFELPKIPGMPNIPMMQKLGSMDMPMPPPPPLGLMQNKCDTEEQAITSMLLSWYMSGYYTGLYEGMKRNYTS